MKEMDLLCVVRVGSRREATSLQRAQLDLALLAELGAMASRFARQGFDRSEWDLWKICFLGALDARERLLTWVVVQNLESAFERFLAATPARERLGAAA